MNFYFLNHTNMGKLSTTLAAGAVAVGLSTNPASADVVKNSLEQQKVQQKLDTVVCKTKTACDLLSQSIQTQIDGLATKGLRNLSRAERVQLGSLKQQFIAVENNKQQQQQVTITAKNTELKIEKAETTQNDNLITAKNTEINAEKAETTQNDNIITAKNTEIKAENNKQQQQQVTITAKNTEIKAEKAETKARLSKVESRLSSIEGSLLSK